MSAELPGGGRAPWSHTGVALAQRPGWMFDLDGTLVDSSDGVILAFHSAQQALGEEPADPEAIRRRIGYPLAETVALLSRLPTDLFVSRFRSEALASMRHHSRLLPGVRELLDALGRRRHLLGVVTSKRRDIALSVLEQLTILSHFRTVVGAECTPEVKPHPAPLLEAARRLGLGPGELVMVGDTQNDVRAARAAGIPAIALTSGVDTAAALASADVVLRDALELHRLVTRDGRPEAPAERLLCVYSKHDCRLCEDLKDRLRARRLRFEERDIRDSDVWQARFAARVPVVVAAGREHAPPFAESLLEAWTGLYR